MLPESSRERVQQIARRLRKLADTRMSPERIAERAIRHLREVISLGAFADEEGDEVREAAETKRPELDGLSHETSPNNPCNVNDDVCAWDAVADYLDEDRQEVRRIRKLSLQTMRARRRCVPVSLIPDETFGMNLIPNETLSPSVRQKMSWFSCCEAVASKLEDELALPAPANSNAGSTPPTATPGQSEGNGGAGLPPGQPEITSGTAREVVLQQLQPAVRKAYLAYEYAEKCAERRLHDREAYDWLHEYAIDQDNCDHAGLEDYTLPDSFATFKRYIVAARKPLGENKNSPRAARTGRSTVRKNQIE